MNLRDDRAGRLILGLRQQGVTDPRVLSAMESIDRAVFVHEKFLDQAWEDQALPIDCAQTISQPYIVGLMTQALDVQARHRVLEIGTGSGYQAAVLSRLARYVYSVERYRSLLTEAENRLRELDIDNVITPPRRRRIGLARAGAVRPDHGHRRRPGRADRTAETAEAAAACWSVRWGGVRCRCCIATSVRRMDRSAAKA